MKYFNFPSLFSNKIFLYLGQFFQNIYVKKILLITLFFLFQIEIDSFVFSYSLAIVLPLFVYFVVVETRVVSFWFLLYISLLFESYVFLPFGFCFCLYFSLWLVLSTTRDLISWQNPFTLFLIALGVNIWVGFMELLLVLSKDLVTAKIISELFISFLLNGIFTFLFFLFLLSRDFLFVRNMR